MFIDKQTISSVLLLLRISMHQDQPPVNFLAGQILLKFLACTNFFFQWVYTLMQFAPIGLYKQIGASKSLHVNKSMKLVQGKKCGLQTVIPVQFTCTNSHAQIYLREWLKRVSPLFRLHATHATIYLRKFICTTQLRKLHEHVNPL